MKNKHVIRRDNDCKICKEVFSSTWNLSDHMNREHTNRRSINCRICGEEFLTKPTLMDHRKSKHIQSVAKCKKIRCVVAYGVQEKDILERKEAFWKYMDENVQQADISEAGFILQFDGNLWAGNKIIPGDPNKQNKNGKLFQKFLEQNPQLKIVNSLPQCEGLITRKRNKKDKMESSVLDFFVVCERVLPFVVKMKIDEEKQFILTNYARAKHGDFWSK